MAPISEVMKEDQQQMRDHYREIIEAEDEEAKKRWRNQGHSKMSPTLKWQEQFVWELARYAVAEELVVYPALESHMDHGKIKDMLAQFQDMSPSDTRYRPMLESIMDNLNRHFEEEQAEDLPSLESVLEPAESEAISKKFERTKVLMPTRVHPNAPTEPFFETAVAFLQAPIDRISDIMWRQFPED
ncbi:hypothetical protein PRK78_004556 [Emydomyces testavorans]|uniref:Hemerythrin-like domain-containing protein n=1 Tax=Emydomyces testavorans TaxID=2070801 RepID=A0AAF0DI97_9EURO|nr:hypothetical protein PRK78_004556 [Emydomyces testavorans]